MDRSRAGYACRCQPLHNHRRATEIRWRTFDSDRTYRWTLSSVSRSASVNRSCWRRYSAQEATMRFRRTRYAP
jgi:hypothetical protein